MSYLVLLFVATVVRESVSYSVGAPARQCDRMYPGHGLAAQVAPSPYTITLSQNTFSCSNDDVTVTLSGSVPFRGFLCQPRPNPEVYAVSGVLASDGVDSVPKQDVCGGGHSLTHASNSNKTRIVFKWRPTTADNVYIVCTVVSSYRIFWVKQRSPVISFVRRECVQRPQASTDSSTNTETRSTTPHLVPSTSAAPGTESWSTPSVTGVDNKTGVTVQGSTGITTSMNFNTSTNQPNTSTTLPLSTNILLLCISLIFLLFQNII